MEAGVGITLFFISKLLFIFLIYTFLFFPLLTFSALPALGLIRLNLLLIAVGVGAIWLQGSYEVLHVKAVGLDGNGLVLDCSIQTCGFFGRFTKRERPGVQITFEEVCIG
jgi:hypothetical protein